MAGKRSGGAFDPDLVAAFRTDPDGILAVIERPSVWEDLLAAEPTPHRMADGTTLIAAGRVMADFADLKSRYLVGHSTRVADLTMAAAERMTAGPAKFDGPELTALRVGALAHDLGRVAVTTAIWDKAGPLTDSEWESVRLHAYYSERLLARSPGARPRRRVGRTAP